MLLHQVIFANAAGGHANAIRHLAVGVSSLDDLANGCCADGGSERGLDQASSTLRTLAGTVEGLIDTPQAFIDLPRRLSDAGIRTGHFLAELGRGRLDADQHSLYVGIGHGFLRA
ncbi:hypothetical protein D3C85_1559500 [compost metagenome]